MFRHFLTVLQKRSQHIHMLKQGRGGSQRLSYVKRNYTFETRLLPQWYFLVFNLHCHVKEVHQLLLVHQVIFCPYMSEYPSHLADVLGPRIFAVCRFRHLQYLATHLPVQGATLNTLLHIQILLWYCSQLMIHRSQNFKSGTFHSMKIFALVPLFMLLTNQHFYEHHQIKNIHQHHDGKATSSNLFPTSQSKHLPLLQLAPEWYFQFLDVLASPFSSTYPRQSGRSFADNFRTALLLRAQILLLC